MPFVNSARETVQQLPPDNHIRIVLEYMLANAVGRANAVSWGQISAGILDQGVRMTKNTFQHSVLAETRSGPIFIGSSKSGYYLIENQADAEAMRDFYENRIAAEQQNLENLRAQSEVEGWNI
jgi:hypothetical protein